MKAAIVLGLLLIATPALAWFPHGSGPGGSPAVDMNFATSTYTGGTLGSLLSVTRAAPATTYATRLDGSLASFSANTPRITDQGVLIEESRTNLMIQSGLSAGYSTSNATLTVNAATSPDGTSDAAFLKENTSNSTHSFTIPTTAFPAETTSTQYTLSFYASNVGSPRNLEILINGVYTEISLQTGQVGALLAGTVGGSAVNCIPASNHFWYCSWTFTSPSSGGLSVQLSITVPGAGVLQDNFSGYLGDGASGIYFHCMQLELAGTPTSCIPTSGSAVTRSADVPSLTGAAATALASSTGTALVNTFSLQTPSVLASLIDANGSALLGFTSTNTLASSITSTTQTVTPAIANRWLGKDYSAVSWDSNGRRVVLDGYPAVTDAVAITPASTFHLGMDGSANFLNGYVARMTLWNTKLATPEANFPLVSAKPDIWVYLAGPEGSGAQNGGYMPTVGDWAYFAAHGVQHGRLTVAWENFQSTAQLGTTTLNASEVSAIQTALTTANAQGMDLVIDIQNYGWYCPTSTWGTTCTEGGNFGGSPAVQLGGGSLPVADFTSLWTGLVNAFSPGGVPHAGLAGYELMNEPSATAGTWPTAAQNAINAIRAVDTTTPIWVGGDGTACAGVGITTAGYCAPSVTGTNLVYTAHTYFDAAEGRSGGGSYGGATNFSTTPATYSVDDYTSVRGAQSFLGWLKFSGNSGVVGEFGAPWNAGNPSWLPNNAHMMATLVQAGVPGVQTFYGNNGAGSTANLYYAKLSGVDNARFLQMQGNY